MGTEKEWVAIVVDVRVVRRRRKWNFSLPSHLHESKDEEAIVLLLVELVAHSAEPDGVLYIPIPLATQWESSRCFSLS